LDAKKQIGRPVERGGRRVGLSCPGPRDVWKMGPAVAQKYEVHQNALFERKFFKKLCPEKPRENVSAGPTVALDSGVARRPGGPVPQSSRQNVSIRINCTKFANLVSLFSAK